MAAADAPGLLREGLLADVTVLTAGGGPGERSGGSFAGAVETLCGGLGARLASVGARDLAGEDGQEGALEDAIGAALAQLGELDVLVVDGDGLFAAALRPGTSERAPLLACLQASWNVTRAFAGRACIARARPARIVYVAPRPGAGAHAEAARAGLENLARTLSIEWARHGVTPVTIAPGASTPADTVAAIVAYLASFAGAYFSGCQLDLRGPDAMTKRSA